MPSPFCEIKVDAVILETQDQSVFLVGDTNVYRMLVLVLCKTEGHIIAGNLINEQAGK